ncbi:MAG: hypothetical protein K1X72_20605 [Pyrinomonadaceae bacterium]|nr:hypothetical protein [Pyrinomonadaceae bacterium]
MKKLFIIFFFSVFSIATFAQKAENKETMSEKENEIFVFGEVVSPKTIKTTKEITLSQAIEMADGLNENDGDSILIIRRNSFLANLLDIKSGKAKDVILQNGDLIIVAKSSKAQQRENQQKMREKLTPNTVKIPKTIT